MPASPTPPPDVPFFSLEEASRMLPLVRRIVADIVEEFAELEHVAESQPRADVQSDVERREARIEELIDELHDLGCRFKGFDEGLVDWYSFYAGRPVFLCWKLDEPEIQWWHQLDAGFRGRQPILSSQRQAFRATPEP